ncbi:MAG: glycerol-3-phosphate 1-O-acyltransferase PlsY [Candidatus Omnitrophica bacterium]|nr:glycerol-3-phosphate 1-O-acyltransferase PlsY [Candidatus Omnitrophota bacterium]
MLKTTFLLIISYLIGSIPFGYLIGICLGRDIRKHGSGNIGATNVFRVLGKKWGILTFILDFAKGLSAPCLVAYFGHSKGLAVILSVILVVCGHNWTVFLQFKGGKGVATSLGAICGLGFIFWHLWIALLLGILTWILIFSISKIVSLASLIASSVFFVSCLFMPLSWEFKLLAFLLLVFIVFRHKSNIGKLLSGKENRFK